MNKALDRIERRAAIKRALLNAAANVAFVILFAACFFPLYL